jgi:hypothetical protein
MSARKSDEARRVGAILKWMGAHEEEMARAVAELVAIPSENPPGKNYRAVAAILEKYIRRFGFMGITMWCPRSPWSSSSPCARSISCLGAALVT